MRRFRDRGLQNQHFSIFFSMGSRPIWRLKRRPKNRSKILPRRNFGAPEKWTPLFGASSRQPWTEHRDVIFDDPYRRYAPWPFQKRPEDLPRTVTTPKIRPPKSAWSAKIQDPNFNKKNVKNVKNEDPCRRSATSLISEDAKKQLFSKKMAVLHGRGGQNRKSLIFHEKAYYGSHFRKL